MRRSFQIAEATSMMLSFLPEANAEGRHRDETVGWLMRSHPYRKRVTSNRSSRTDLFPLSSSQASRGTDASSACSSLGRR